jgi:hypothetical protein
MVWSITLRESYVGETGKSMKAEEMAGILAHGLAKNPDFAQNPRIRVLSQIAWLQHLHRAALCLPY